MDDAMEWAQRLDKVGSSLMSTGTRASGPAIWAQVLLEEEQQDKNLTESAVRSVEQVISLEYPPLRSLVDWDALDSGREDSWTEYRRMAVCALYVLAVKRRSDSTIAALEQLEHGEQAVLRDVFSTILAEGKEVDRATIDRCFSKTRDSANVFETVGGSITPMATPTIGQAIRKNSSTSSPISQLLNSPAVRRLASELNRKRKDAREFQMDLDREKEDAEALRAQLAAANKKTADLEEMLRSTRSELNKWRDAEQSGQTADELRAKIVRLETKLRDLSEAHSDCDGLLKRLEEADEENSRFAERHEILSAKVKQVGEANVTLEQEVAAANMARSMLEEECKRLREMVEDQKREIAEMKEILHSRSSDISNRSLNASDVICAGGTPMQPDNAAFSIVQLNLEQRLEEQLSETSRLKAVVTDKDNVIAELRAKEQLLAAEREHISEQLSELQTRCEAVQQDNNALQGKIGAMETDFSERIIEEERIVAEQQTKIDSLEETSDVLRAEVAECKRAREETRSECTEMRARYKSAERDKEVLRGKISTLESKCDKRDRRLDELENAESALRAENQQIGEKCDELQASLNVALEEKQELQERACQLEARLEKAETHASALTSKQQELAQLLETKEAGLEQMKTELEATKQFAAEETSKLRDQLQINDKRIRELEMSESELRAERDDISEMLDSMHTQVAMVEEEKKRQEEKIRELAAKLEESENCARVMTSREQELAAIIKSKEADLEQVKAELEERKREASEELFKLRDQVQAKDERIHQLEMAESGLRAECETISDRCTSLQSLLDTAEEENETQKELVRQLETKQHELASLVGSSKTELDQITADLEEKKQLAAEEVGRIGEQLRIKDETIRELEKDREVSAQQVSDLNKAQEDLQRQLGQLSQEHEKLRSRHSSSDGERAALQEEVMSLLSKIEDLERVREQLVAEQQRCAELEEAERRIGAELSDVAAKCEVEKSEKERLATELGKREAMHRDAQSEISQEVSVYKTRCEQAETETETLRQTVGQLELDKVKMAEETRDQKHKICLLEEEQARIKSECTAIQTNYEAALKATDELKTELRTAGESKIAEQERFRLEVQAKLELYEKEKKALEATIAEQKQQFESVVLAKEQLISEHQQTSKSLKEESDRIAQETRTKLEVAETEKQELKSALIALEQKCESLQATAKSESAEETVQLRHELAESKRESERTAAMMADLKRKYQAKLTQLAEENNRNYKTKIEECKNLFAADLSEKNGEIKSLKAKEEEQLKQISELQKSADLFKKKYEASKKIIERLTKSKKLPTNDTIAADITKASTSAEAKASSAGKKAPSPVLKKAPSPVLRKAPSPVLRKAPSPAAKRPSPPALKKSTSASSMPSATSSTTTEVFKAPQVMSKHTPGRSRQGRTQSEVLMASRRRPPAGAGSLFHTDDEAGEMWSSSFLSDLKEGRNDASFSGRLSELSRRNTMVPPHLKSSYPAETQFFATAAFSDSDLQMGKVKDSAVADITEKTAGLKVDSPASNTRSRRTLVPSASANFFGNSNRENEHAPSDDVIKRPKKRLSSVPLHDVANVSNGDEYLGGKKSKKTEKEALGTSYSKPGPPTPARKGARSTAAGSRSNISISASEKSFDTESNVSVRNMSTSSTVSSSSSSKMRSRFLGTPTAKNVRKALASAFSSKRKYKVAPK